MQPNWYSYSSNGAEPAAEANGHTGMGLRSLPCDDTWRSPWVVAEKHPHPRFEHTCCLIGSTMYLFGGNTGEPANSTCPEAPQHALEALSRTAAARAHAAGRARMIAATV